MLKPYVHIVYLLLLLFLGNIYPGNNGNGRNGRRLWNQLALNGAVAAEGLYRSRESLLRSNLKEDYQTSSWLAMFLLRSRSYVWHPSFLLLDLDMEFSPGSRRDQYLVSPDRSETRTAEKLGFFSTFFSQRPLSLSFYVNYNHSYFNRELLTNIDYYKRDFGSILNFRNRILPVSLKYLQEKWQQTELQTGRHFVNKRKGLEGEISRSFFRRDNHQFRAAYQSYTRDYGISNSVKHNITDINLRDRIFFDEEQMSGLQSFIWYYRQSGQDEFNRLQIFENATAKLPYSLQWTGGYHYSRLNRRALASHQHQISTGLYHQLFLSLRSQIFYEYSYLSQTAFRELLNTSGFALEYRKKIPTGHLLLNYEFRLRHLNHNSQPQPLIIVDERHQLTDGEIVLLDNPFVLPGSMVVHNMNRTLIYQENIDYVLIERGNFTEIQRIPGGQIQNGQEISIDYQARQQMSYKFDAVNNRIGGSLLIFRNLMELYVRYFDQDYKNVGGGDLRILKYITRHLYGIRLSWQWLSGGAEYDDFQSNIVPYQSQRYYITVSRRLLDNLNFMITGNLRNYLLTTTDEQQQFRDLSGSIFYHPFRNTGLKIDGIYRLQNGRGIDLNLSAFRMEISTSYRRVILTLGGETYRRDFSGEVLNFNGAYFRVTRQF